MRQMNRERTHTGLLCRLRIFFIVILILTACSVILLSCVPPVSRDALTHHLAIPKLWLTHGGVYEIPAIEFSYYPMNLDLLYMIPLYLGNDIIPKFIHFSFALFTAWLIFAYLRKRLNILYALSGVLLFLSLPVIVKLSVTVYVDLGLIFFSTASLIYLFKWIENHFRIRFLLMSAFWCGLALGTKYNGLVTFFLLTSFVPLVYSKLTDSKLSGDHEIPGKEKTKQALNSAKEQIRAAGYGLIFLSVAIIVFSPWMIRNYIWTQNPVYPLYDKLFNPPPVGASADKAPGNGRVGHFTLRSVNYGEPWWEVALIPVRIFFQGQDNSPKYFDGKLNPLLFFLPFFAGYRRRELGIGNWELRITNYELGIRNSETAKNPGRSARSGKWGVGSEKPPLKGDVFIIEKRILLAFSILFLLFAFFRIDMRIRYIAPIIPPLVILSVFGLHEILSFLKKRCSAKWEKFASGAVSVVICFLIGMNISYIAEQFEHIDPIPYISGKITRDEYITKYRKEYPAVQFANRNLPEDAKIFGVFLGNRLYHSDREMIFDIRLLQTIIRDADSPGKIMQELNTKRISHLLIRYDLFNKWTRDNFDEGTREKLGAFSENYLKLLFYREGYGLFQLQNQ